MRINNVQGRKLASVLVPENQLFPEQIQIELDKHEYLAILRMWSGDYRLKTKVLKAIDATKYKTASGR